MATGGGREGIDRLAGRVIRAGVSPAVPWVDLCAVARDLADALDACERAGGADPRRDVLARDEFRELIVLARCRTALPRPEGRWEIALSDGEHDEWVIGEAGGGWSVEGLERLTGGTPPGHRVSVDDRAPGGRLPTRSRRRRPTVGWFPDPSSRHDLRYFDGAGWTCFVVDAHTPGTTR